MALTPIEQQRLDDILAEISQIESRLAVAHGLGDSHSSQGVSATFSDNMQWRKQLSYLRAARDRLVAKQTGDVIPAKPGLNLSNYCPT